MSWREKLAERVQEPDWLTFLETVAAQVADITHEHPLDVGLEAEEFTIIAIADQPEMEKLLAERFAQVDRHLVTVNFVNRLTSKPALAMAVHQHYGLLEGVHMRFAVRVFAHRALQ